MGMGIPLQWHKRHAITLAGQLPDGIDDALIVIEAMKELVEQFLMATPEAPEGRPPNVLQFGTIKP